MKSSTHLISIRMARLLGREMPLLGSSDLTPVPLHQVASRTAPDLVKVRDGVDANCARTNPMQTQSSSVAVSKSQKTLPEPGRAT